MFRKTALLLAAFFFAAQATPVLRADTRTIAKLDLRDVGVANFNASHWIEQGPLRPDTPLYGDTINLPAAEQSTLAAIPPALADADYLQPSANSRNFTDSVIATFELREPAEIYIAHSDALATKPAWLAPYTATPEKLTDTLGNTFTLYKRTAKKSDLIPLGPNGSPAAPMYLTFIKPLANEAQSAIRNPQSEIIDIATQGAKNDGVTINTTIIQKTIDTLSTRPTGGTVLIRRGTYLTGTLELKTNVTLHIEAGAILRGSPDHADFPPKHSTLPGYRNAEPYQLIYAENAQNIAITGGGVIDGYGVREGFPWSGRGNENARPRVIRMVSCKNIRIENITLIRSPNWTQYYEGCSDMTLRNITVRSYTGVANQDGLDLSGCRNVHLDGFNAIAGDDTVCIKSMSLVPNENILIENVHSAYSNFHIFKIGTETHTAVKNVRARNLTGYARCGLAIETVDGAALENITIEDVDFTSSGTPLFIRLGARSRTFAGGPKPAHASSMRDITIRNIRNRAANDGGIRQKVGVGSAICGLPNLRIQNLTIENCDLIYNGAAQDPALITRDIPENPTKYPEFHTFGPCPAYGLYLRHIDNLTLRNTRIRAAKPDIRPAIVLDDVTNSTLTDLAPQSFPNTTPSPIWTKPAAAQNSAP